MKESRTNRPKAKRKEKNKTEGQERIKMIGGYTYNLVEIDAHIYIPIYMKKTTKKKEEEREMK